MAEASAAALALASSPMLAASTHAQSVDSSLAGAGTARSHQDTPLGSTPDLRRKLAYSSMALGASGVVLAAVMGGLALDRKHTLDDHCHPHDNCPPEYDDEREELKRFANVSTAGMAIAFVGAGLAAYLWFTPKTSAARAHTTYLAPRLGLGAAGLAGTF